MDIQQKKQTSDMVETSSVFNNLSEFLSNDALFRAYDLVQAPIAIITPDAEIKSVNHQFSELFTSLAPNYVKHSLASFFKADQRAEFEKLLLTKSNFAFSFEINLNEGKAYNFTAHASYVKFADPNSACFVTTFEYEELENKIVNVEKEEVDFELVFESLPQPVVVYSCNSVIITANMAACKLLGYSQKELAGLKVEDIIRKNFSSEVESQLAQVRQSKELLFGPEVITKNGKSISVEPQSFVLKQPTTPLIATLFRVLEDDLNNRKQLINAIIDTEINERKRFAKDLHDGLGPLLSAVKLYVSELKATKIKAKEREDLVKIITELVDEAIQNARETANSLMPTVIRNYGLISAVQSFISKINYLNKQKINFTVEPAVFTLDNALETSLYRIIKELVNNTLKHANAKNIDIALIFKDNVLSLDFSDDGVGFDFEQIQKSQASGLGLNNMINRVHLLNGKINFNTSKGNGFKLHIVIELDKMFVSKT